MITHTKPRRPSLIDMPNRRAALLVKLCLQNGGRLSQSKRSQFAEITEEELQQVEAAIHPLIRPTDEQAEAGRST